MNLNRPRTAAFIAAGALCLAVVAPTAAFADSDDREERSLDVCERSNVYKCDNWNYFQNSGYVYDGTPIVLGADSYTCPADQTQSSTTSTIGKTIGWTKSWRVGGDIDNKFFGTVGVKVSASYGEGTSESVTTSASYTKPIPKGEIGHMIFTPKMYYSEGQMNWTMTDVASEFHDKDDYKTQVESRSPMSVRDQPGLAAGTYGLESRPMNSDELKSNCKIDPTPVVPPIADRMPVWDFFDKGIHPIMDRPLEKANPDYRP